MSKKDKRTKIDFTDSFLSSGNRTVSIKGVLEPGTDDNPSMYLDQKGYVDVDGFIWIFSSDKPKHENQYPYFWFDEDGNKKFSKPSDEMKNIYHQDNIVSMGLVDIINLTEPNEELFDEKEIEDMNAAAAFYTPEIKQDDDYLKKVTKAVISCKGIDINRLKNKTGEKYQVPNMKSALTNGTKMSVLYFCIWMNLLGCTFEIIAYDSGEDTQNPLKNPICYNSYNDSIGEIVNGEIKPINTFKKEIDEMINEGE